MDVAQLQNQYDTFANTVYRSGYLSNEFTQLQGLVDEKDPNFFVDVMTSFFDGSDKILQDFASVLEKPVTDFKQVLELAINLKGSSASVGAKKVKNLATAIRDFAVESIREGCLTALRQLNIEYAATRNKIETLLSLRGEIIEAGGVVPTVE